MLEYCFEPLTREKPTGGPLILICDGLGAVHQVCASHNIIRLLLLPCSTHICRPLDVGMSKRRKNTTRIEFRNLFDTGIHVEKAK